jgi:NAD(P)-dependent dehydrogenase (short-subunit alcohol dehydrogenase family)
LEDVATECRDFGADAFTALTDVGSEEQVCELARAAVGRFGRIDAWINNAA